MVQWVKEGVSRGNGLGKQAMLACFLLMQSTGGVVFLSLLKLVDRRFVYFVLNTCFICTVAP